MLSITVIQFFIKSLLRTKIIAFKVDLKVKQALKSHTTLEVRTSKDRITGNQDLRQKFGKTTSQSANC